MSSQCTVIVYSNVVTNCRKETNQWDTSQLYQHKHGTTDTLKSMDNSKFNRKFWIRDGSSKELEFSVLLILRF